MLRFPCVSFYVADFFQHFADPAVPAMPDPHAPGRFFQKDCLFSQAQEAVSAIASAVAQDLEEYGVKGAERRLGSLCFFFGPAQEARLHFGGGRTGESQDEDLPCGDAFLEQAAEPLYNDGCFAGAGAGQRQARAVKVGDGLALRFVESFVHRGFSDLLIVCGLAAFNGLRTAFR